MLCYLILALVFAFVMEFLGLAVLGKFVIFFVFVLLLLLKLQIKLNWIHQRFACLKVREVALYTFFNEGKEKKTLGLKKEKCKFISELLVRCYLETALMRCCLRKNFEIKKIINF